MFYSVICFVLTESTLWFGFPSVGFKMLLSIFPTAGHRRCLHGQSGAGGQSGRAFWWGGVLEAALWRSEYLTLLHCSIKYIIMCVFPLTENVISSRKSTSCRLRSGTFQSWWRWTTAAILIWTPSSLKCALSTKMSPTGAELKLSRGTRTRWKQTHCDKNPQIPKLYFILSVHEGSIKRPLQIIQTITDIKGAADQQVILHFRIKICWADRFRKFWRIMSK